MDRWRCSDASCPNSSGHCYIGEGVHLRIIPQHLKTWSMAINDADGDIDTIPEHLGKTLMPVKTSKRNPFRETASKTLHERAVAAQATHPSPSPFLSYPYGYYPFAGPPMYPQSPYPPPVHPQHFPPPPLNTLECPIYHGSTGPLPSPPKGMKSLINSAITLRGLLKSIPRRQSSWENV